MRISLLMSCLCVFPLSSLMFAMEISLLTPAECDKILKDHETQKNLTALKELVITEENADSYAEKFNENMLLLFTNLQTKTASYKNKHTLWHLFEADDFNVIYKPIVSYYLQDNTVISENFILFINAFFDTIPNAKLQKDAKILTFYAISKTSAFLPYMQNEQCLLLWDNNANIALHYIYYLQDQIPCSIAALKNSDIAKTPGITAIDPQNIEPFLYIEFQKMLTQLFNTQPALITSFDYQFTPQLYAMVYNKAFLFKKNATENITDIQYFFNLFNELLREKYKTTKYDEKIDKNCLLTFLTTPIFTNIFKRMLTLYEEKQAFMEQINNSINSLLLVISANSRDEQRSVVHSFFKHLTELDNQLVVVKSQDYIILTKRSQLNLTKYAPTPIPSTQPPSNAPRPKTTYILSGVIGSGVLLAFGWWYMKKYNKRSLPLLNYTLF